MLEDGRTDGETEPRRSPERQGQGADRLLVPSMGQSISTHHTDFSPLSLMGAIRTPPPFTKEDPVLREGKPPTPSDIGGRSGVRMEPFVA